MNAGRDVERLIADWFVEEAVLRAPDRVLLTAGRAIDRTKQRRLGAAWRAILMPVPRLVAAAAVIGVLLVGGAFLVLRPNLGTIGSSTPMPSASSALGPLDQTYNSRRYGYAIDIPADWTVIPATRIWRPGTATAWGDPENDQLASSTARLVIASQPLQAGETPATWIAGYCERGGTDAQTCSRYATDWPSIPAGNQTAFVDLDGVPASEGTIKPGGPVFDAVAVVNGQGYEFTLDGAVTRADFQRLLATIVFTTPFGSKTDNLTATFSSPLYGYSIGLDPTWTARAATVLIDDPASTEENSSDNFAVTGTDSHITGAAGAMPSGWTFQQWLDDHHKDVLAGAPTGCDGGDPSTWPAVTVGDHDGLLDQMCNAAEVDVHVGDRVYMFGWSNETFEGLRHLDQSEFTDRVLPTVRFLDSAEAPTASP